MLDEWDVHDCDDVRDVIDWAVAQNTTAYEVGVRWPYSALQAPGVPVIRYRYTRVAGKPGDDSATTHVEVFIGAD